MPLPILLLITCIAFQRPTKLLKTWHVRSDWPNRSWSDWQPKGSQKGVWRDISKLPSGLTHIQVLWITRNSTEMKLLRSHLGKAGLCKGCGMENSSSVPKPDCTNSLRGRYWLKQELSSFCSLRIFPPSDDKVLARWYANSLWLWKVLTDWILKLSEVPIMAGWKGGNGGERICLLSQTLQTREMEHSL